MRHYAKSFSWLATGMLALALLLSSVLPAAAQEQPGGLRMTAWTAFDGHFKYGEWLTLWVQLENSGLAQEGEIQVRITGRGGAAVYAAPVSMPTGSRKLIPLYTLPNNFSHSLEVQFISGSTVLSKQTITVRAQPNISYLVGIASPERGGLSNLMTAQLPGNNRKIVLVDFRLEDLPDRPEGLRSFDTLILNNVETASLTLQQNSALETWVRQGGRLVIAGGAGLIHTAAGLNPALLPAVPRAVEELDDLSGLSRFAGDQEVRVIGPFIGAATSDVSGSVLASQGSLPLVIEKNLGRGFIDLIALDVSASPFDAWAGAPVFWQTLLSPNAAYSTFLPPDMSPRQMVGNQMMYALSNLPSLDLPSIRGLALLLGIYIGLVGPVNYLVLRWRRRLHWAWVTIPLITLIFSAGAFGLGYLLRGNDLILNQVVVAELQPGGSAYTRRFYGLFSPSQTSYEIEVSGDGLISQLNVDYDPWSARPGGGEVVMIQGQPSRLRGLSVNQWSMQAFTSEGFWSEIGELKGQLVMEGSKISGSVVNQTGIDLKQSVLVMGNQIIRLGDLAAGETRQIDTQVVDLMGPVFGPPLSYRIFEEEFNQPRPGGIPRELNLKQSIIDGMMTFGSGAPAMTEKFASAAAAPAGEILFLGWFDHSPDQIRVGGRVPAAQTTSLLYGSIPYEVSATSGAFVPPGIIPGKMVEVPVDGGQCGPGGSLSVYLNRGAAVFEFDIPGSLAELEIETLLVQVGTEGGWMRLPELSLYNWETGTWAAVSLPQAGANRVAYHPDLVNSSNLVRVQLANSEGSTGGCYYLGLGLEGKP